MRTGLSTDYKYLFDRVIKGNKHLGLVDYKMFINSEVLKDPVQIKKLEGGDSIEIGCRGLCYAHSKIDFEQFERACKSVNLIFIP